MIRDYKQGDCDCRIGNLTNCSDTCDNNYIFQAEEVMCNIPLNERNSVYYYLVQPRFYPLLKVSTNYKYFAHQEWIGTHNLDIYIEINEMMNDDKPLWVMKEKSEIENWKDIETRNKEFRIILAERYEVHADNEMFILYHLK